MEINSWRLVYKMHLRREESGFRREKNNAQKSEEN